VQDFDTIRQQLSSEVALMCDRAGAIRWADARATRLLAVQSDSHFAGLAAPGSEIKARSFLEAACTAETSAWELVIRANGDLLVMTWRGAPVSGGAVVVGNLVPQQYSGLQEQLTGAVSDLTVLQRETERRRQLLDNARRQLELLLASEHAARSEADLALERAAAAGRVRDVFLSTLAHDLKAPLANVSWYMQVLDRKLRTGKLEPSQLSHELEPIRASAAQVMAAVDELHDLARTTEGAPISLKREPVDLVSLVLSIVTWRRESTQHAVSFQSSVDTLEVSVDAARLSRAIQNLLDNAIKYSPPAEPVSVGLALELRDGLEWATLSVEDHGIGIREVDLPHIFEAYYRGRNADSISGQGLGLASVRQLVEAHGGHVTVHSEPGVGSVFVVQLPVASAVAANSE
jgi:signal transduction histidine kinase